MRHARPLRSIALTTFILTNYSINADAATKTVQYHGYQYVLSATNTDYSGDTALLSSQAWWGDSSLAGVLAQKVGYKLGDAFGNPPSSAIGPAPFFAYRAGTEVFSGIPVDYVYALGADPNAGVVNSYSLDQSYNYLFVTGYKTLLFTLAKVQESLISSNSALQSTLSQTDLIVNGAHSHPLSHQVETGKTTLWLTGDWGNDTHAARDGTAKLAEFGGGYNFGSAQLNLSIGKTWSNQNLVQDGSLNSYGKYIMFEGILPISQSNGVYATLGTYEHWSGNDIRRGYLSMGSQQYSMASPDSFTWGLRARLDWQNAFAVGNTTATPYLDLWHSETKLDSYTEIGGEFPAQFDSRNDSVTELRIGLNTTTPVMHSGFEFLTSIEAAHRFDRHGVNTTGAIIDLYSFNLKGQQYDQNWVKASAGFQGKIAKGDLFLMLNFTNKGSMPSSWLSTSYQLSF